MHFGLNSAGGSLKTMETGSSPKDNIQPRVISLLTFVLQIGAPD